MPTNNRRSEGDALLAQFGNRSTQQCVESAVEVIHIINNVEYRLLGAWWFTMYYGKYFLVNLLCSFPRLTL